MVKTDSTRSSTAPLPQSDVDVLRLLEANRFVMGAFEAVAAERLPDWWIVAGFVRNPVWDALHGNKDATPAGDVDVVFFDPGRPAAEDRAIAARLAARAPSYPWEVYNQAHMHTFNGHAPYRDTVDAFGRWAETVSAIGLTAGEDGRLRLAAPHGIEDLLAMVVRPTPHPDARRDVFEERLRTKRWRERWPLVRVTRGEGEPPRAFVRSK